jgi:hypothetical protein
MIAKPKRRWFRFSLRTLFVLVTVFCVWLGFQFNWIYRRHRALEWMQDQAKYWDDMPVSQKVWLGTRTPWPIAMLGEEGLEQVCVIVDDEKTAAEKQVELRRLFPEGDVFVQSPGPGYSGKHSKK